MGKTATIAFILAVLSIIIWPLSIAAIILGIIALKKSEDPAEGGRGISIAAIAIGSIVLVLGLVLLVFITMFADKWGRLYTDQTADEVRQTADEVGQKSNVDVKCSIDVRIKLMEIAGRNQICYGTGFVGATVLNDGSKNIDALSVIVVGEEGLATVNLDNSSLVRGSAIKLRAEYNRASVGNLASVSIIPHVTIDGQLISCRGSSSVIEVDSSDIPACA